MRCTIDMTTTMKLITCSLLALCLALTGCSDSSSNSKVTLTVATIEQNPNSYTENGNIIGTDVDIAKLAAADAGINLNFEMLNTAQQAIETTQAGPKRALLGIAYSAEREDRFQWVGPISKGRYVIFAKKDTNIATQLSQPEAQKIASVAVVEGWLETITLEERGFKNLRYYPSYAEAYQAFDNDEVEAIASDLMQLAAKVRGEYVIGEDIKLCFSYKTPFYYMAFSKDVDPAVIDAMQQSLNQLIKDETTLEVTKNYFPTATKQIIPDVLQLMTAVSTPFTIVSGPVNNYSVDGAAIDVVDEIQRRNGYQATIDQSSWEDEFDVVKYLPNSACFTTVRTAERDELFQWVGPIAALHPGLYTLASKNLIIADLAAAKAQNLSISTPYGWSNHEHLVDNGIVNINSTANDSSGSFQQLINGDVDAAFIDAETIDWLCENGGIDRAAVALQFESTQAYREGWISFSLTTPAATVQQWRASFESMQDDGTFGEIWQRWFGDIPAPTGEFAQ